MTRRNYFLEGLVEKIQQQPESICYYYYPEAETMHEVTYGDVHRLISGRIRALKANLEPGALFFIIDNDVLEQALWWLAALFAGVVPGILTPPTAKLDKRLYLRDLHTILDAYKTAKVHFGGHIISEDMFDPAFRAYQLQYDENEMVELDSLEVAHRAAGVPLVFQQTSGTTGIRKGILLSEQDIINQMDSYGSALEISSNDILVTWVPLYHDMGLVGNLMQATYNAVPLAITSPFVWLAKPDWLFWTIYRLRATMAYLPNFAFNLLAERLNVEDYPPDMLSSVRMLLSGGEVILGEVVLKFQEKFQALGFNPLAMSSLYGAAECVMSVVQSPAGRGIVVERIDREIYEREGRAVLSETGDKLVASSGRRIAGADFKITRADGSECDEGELGEIFSRSNSMMTGYFGVGEGMQAIDKQGWFAQGDIGYHRNGEIFVVGRRKDVIIRGGRNLNPNDIEGVLNEVEGAKPGRTVAFGIMNEREATEDIIVMVEFGGERVSDIDEIKMRIYEALGSRLDLTPQHVEVVRPNWLVKSSSGKISRPGCRDKYQQMLELRKNTYYLAGDYTNNLSEDQMDSFAYFGRDAKIRTPSEISNPRYVEIGNWVSMGRYGKLNIVDDFTVPLRFVQQHYPDTEYTYDPAVYSKRTPRLKIGDGTTIGDFFFITCSNSITIGKHVGISARVFITDTTHVTDHPVIPIMLQSNTLGRPVVIKDGAWIGINVVIMDGVTIGKNAVVSANSVVTRDVPDYAVVAGNPARIVKFLGDETTAHYKSAEHITPYDMEKPENGYYTESEDEQPSSLTTFLLNYFRQKFGFEVSEDRSLFKSGLVDSLGTVDLIISLEEWLKVSLDEAAVMAQKPDTVSDLTRIIEPMLSK